MPRKPLHEVQPCDCGKPLKTPKERREGWCSTCMKKALKGDD